MIRKIRRRIRDFFRHQQGVALIELAFVFPFVMLLMMGAIEVTRYVMISQKVERAGYALGDMLSQTEPAALTLTTLDNIFKQYTTIMSPYGAISKQAVVLSSVKKDAADHKIKIKWQHAGGGLLTNAKTVSNVSNRNVNSIDASVNETVATFTGDLATQLSTMVDTENMIVAEVFFQYDPVMGKILSATTADKLNLGPRTLVRRTYFHPRNGDLDTIISEKRCALPWGGTIADKEYVTAWQSPTAVPCPGCISEVRVCNNGILSGSYGNQNCALNWGGTTTTVCEAQLDATQNTCEAGSGTFQKGPVIGKCGGSEDNYKYECCGGSPPPPPPPPATCGAGQCDIGGICGVTCLDDGGGLVSPYYPCGTYQCIGGATKFTKSKLCTYDCQLF